MHKKTESFFLNRFFENHGLKLLPILLISLLGCGEGSYLSHWKQDSPEPMPLQSFQKNTISYRWLVPQDSQLSGSLILELDRQAIDRVHLSAVDVSGKFYSFGQSGRKVKYSDKAYPTAIPRIPLEIPQGIRLKTITLDLEHNGLLVVNPRILSSASFQVYLKNFHLLQGVYLGSFSIFVLLGLFFFRKTGDKLYFFYILYIFSYALCLTSYNGIITDIFGLENFELIRRFPYLFYTWILYSQFLMIVTYLKQVDFLKNKSNAWLLHILFLLLFLFFSFVNFFMLTGFLLAFTILSQICVLWIVIRVKNRDRQGIDLFLVTRLIMVLSLTVWMLSVFGAYLGPGGFYLRLAGELLLFFDASLFLFSMGKKFQMLILEKSNLEAKLYQTQKKMFVLSHQLKSPLSNAKIGIDLLEKKSLSQREKTKLFVSLQKGIEEALLFSERIHWNHKLQTEDLHPKLNKHLILDLVSESLLRVQHLADEKALSFEIQIPETVQIKTNALFLTQILLNLLSNAIAASPPYESIQILWSQNTLTFQNKGKAIPEEDLYKIRNGTGSINNSSKSDATGLGLGIVREVSLLLGIAWSIESDPIRGTRVSLKF